MNVPKTLILGINMHGEIHLKEDGNVLMGIVPNNIRVTVINAVVPGVPNISTLENYENMAENVSEKIHSIQDYNNLTPTQIDELTTDIKNLLTETNEEQSTDIIKEHQRLYSKNQVNVDFQRFAHSYGNSFKVATYNAGQNMPNKLYLKFLEGEMSNPDDISENYFNKIVAYNLEGEPDIFEILESIGMDINEITTFQLIEFLQSLGVENLIIIDLSCYVFKGETNYLTERNIRYNRRKLMGKGGKHRKTKKAQGNDKRRDHNTKRRDHNTKRRNQKTKRRNRNTKRKY